MRNIDKIIIHCSATPEGRDVKSETIKEWHLQRGWSDIGYHYVIELDGTLKKGRKEDVIGAHVKGLNKNSIGICYVGGCDKNMNPKDTRTEEQKKTLEMLLTELTFKYKASIHGHNEFSSKDCPSFDVSKEYKDFSSK